MAFGDSDCLFTGTATQTPLQGVGQGNGAGPQICAAVSSPIFDMVCNSGHGSTLPSFLTQGMVKFVGFGFVDDLDLMQWTTLLPEPLQAFSINYNKPLIYGKWDFKHLAVLYWLNKPMDLSQFLLEKGQWEYKSKQELPRTLLMNDISGSQIPLDQLEPHKAKWSLGI